MSKKNNKRLRRELAKANANLALMQAEKSKAEDEAAYYKKRFRDLGSNVKTMDESPSGGRLVVQSWTVDVIPYGGYCYITDGDRYDGGDEFAAHNIVSQIAEALIKKNLVQFIYQRDPINRLVSIGAKLFVVPWEQTPHQRTMEIKQFVDDLFFKKGET